MNRLVKNWITSLVGVLIMAVALFLYIGHKYGAVEVELSLMELIIMLLLGWVFLMAKDSLLTGLFMGIFKIKAKEDASEKCEKPNKN